MKFSINGSCSDGTVYHISCICFARDIYNEARSRAVHRYPYIYLLAKDNISKCEEICAQSPVIFQYHPYHSTDVTDVTLGVSDKWLETRIGAGGTATLA